MESKKNQQQEKIIRKNRRLKPIGEIQCYASCGPVYWEVDESGQTWEKWEIWGEWE